MNSEAETAALSGSARAGAWLPSITQMPSRAQMIGALLTGVFVVLAFPLFGDRLAYGNVGLDLLILVALVPLFLAATGGGVRRGLLLGWAAGMVIEGAGFLWLLFAIRSFTNCGAFLASLGFGIWLAYASLLWVLLGGALGACRQPRHLLIVLFFWIALEHYFPRLFTWQLGGALYSREVLVQCVDVVGASGLTALVFLANAVGYFLVSFFRGRGRFPLASLATLVLLIGGALAYGNVRLPQLRELQRKAPQYTVLLMQGFLKPFELKHSRLEHYLTATRRTLADLPSEPGRPVDLLLWPEGADDFWFGVDLKHDPWLLPARKSHPFSLLYGHVPEARQALESLLAGGAQSHGVRALVTGGSGVHADNEAQTSNLAVYLRPGAPPASFEKPEFYEKNVRMPLGEWVPFLDAIPPSWLQSLGIYIQNRIAGDGNRRFEFGDGSFFRCLICYEAVLPDYVRRSAQGADFFVNLTEDIWYGRTAHIPQHVSMLILRAVENRTAIVRCTNAGPSGVVGITGTFDAGSVVFAPAAVVKTFSAATEATIYQRIGYLFPLLAVVLTLMSTLLVRRRAEKLQ